MNAIFLKDAENVTLFQPKPNSRQQKYTTDCISCHLICLIMKLFGKKTATYNAKHVSKEIFIFQKAFIL